MDIINKINDEYIITTDKTKLNLKIIHNFLTNQSYWSRNIPFNKVKTAIDNSLNFGLFYKDQQIGFARVISDFSTVAYLGDVFILKEYRGRGLSKWLMEVVISHPDLQELRRWILLTGDAHELYKKYGWKQIANPDKWMEKHNPNVYQENK